MQEIPVTSSHCQPIKHDNLQQRDYLIRPCHKPSPTHSVWKQMGQQLILAVNCIPYSVLQTSCRLVEEDKQLSSPNIILAKQSKNCTWTYLILQMLLSFLLKVFTEKIKSIREVFEKKVKSKLESILKKYSN